MKITVENLGVIKEGSIEIPNEGGGMTILAGGNNSGKSYMSYLIYGYFKTITYEDKNDSFHSMYLEKLNKNIITETKLNKFLIPNGISININEFLNECSQEHQDLISSILESLSYNIFSKKIDYTAKIKIPFKNYLEIKEGENYIEQANYKFHIRIQKNSVFTLTTKDKIAMLDNVLVDVLQKVLVNFFPFTNTINFFPAERSAINLFSKEIFREKALERDELARKIQMGQDLEKLLGEYKSNGTFTPRYPLAVSDYIYFVNDLRYAVEKPETEFADIANDIQAILQGTVGLSSFGDLQFTPSVEAKKLPLHLASSLVKSLSGLIIYFRHLAKEGDVVMIDEPELNLHPDNQIRLARVLSKIANRGFNLIFSTHSDYILKELSNLTILSNEFEEKESLLEKYGYDKASILPKDKIKVYAFQNQTIEEIPVTEEGFDVTKIDEVIADMAQRSDDIYFSFTESLQPHE